MILKPGAWIENMKPPMLYAGVVANDIWKELGITEGVTITEGSAGKHMRGSRHLIGYALDFRTHYFSGERKETAAKMLRDRLGPDFDVIVEATHIHVEFDPDGWIERKM